MRRLLGFIIITGLMLGFAASNWGTAASKITLIAWACYLTLVAFAMLDSGNILKMSLLRFLPAVLGTVYVVAFAGAFVLLKEELNIWSAAYLGLLGIFLADFLGQRTMGEAAVVQMGRDDSSRPGRKRKKSGLYY